MRKPTAAARTPPPISLSRSSARSAASIVIDLCRDSSSWSRAAAALAATRSFPAFARFRSDERDVVGVSGCVRREVRRRPRRAQTTGATRAGRMCGSAGRWIARGPVAGQVAGRDPDRLGQGRRNDRDRRGLCPTGRGGGPDVGAGFDRRRSRGLGRDDVPRHRSSAVVGRRLPGGDAGPVDQHDLQITRRGREARHARPARRRPARRPSTCRLRNSLRAPPRRERRTRPHHEPVNPPRSFLDRRRHATRARNARRMQSAGQRVDRRGLRRRGSRRGRRRT